MGPSSKGKNLNPCTAVVAKFEPVPLIEQLIGSRLLVLFSNRANARGNQKSVSPQRKLTFLWRGYTFILIYNLEHGNTCLINRC